MAICKWSDSWVCKLLMLLKSNPYPPPPPPPHLLPINTLLESAWTHICPYPCVLLPHAFHTLRLCSCPSAPCIFLSTQPMVGKQIRISFVNTSGTMILGAVLTSSSFFFFSPNYNGQSSPAWADHQLAVPAGCPRTLEPYQADRASIPAAKTQQMHRTEADITKSGD